MFAGTFPPSGWMTCQGQLVPISENETLFQLIGTTYGGDGQETFQLPDLQGRIPIHQGQGGGLSNYTIGESGGVENVTLNTNQIPQHQHLAVCNNNQSTKSSPDSSAILSTQNVGAGTDTPNAYAPYVAGTAVTMPPSTVQNAGGSQPHDNIQPVLTITYCISLFGVFPSPT
jgi:microcystin-dependent protein